MTWIFFYFVYQCISTCPECFECEECPDCLPCPECEPCPPYQTCPECNICPDVGDCYECEKCPKCQNKVFMHSIKKSKENTNSVPLFQKKININVHATKLGVCCKCDDNEVSQAEEIISSQHLIEEFHKNQLLIMKLSEKLKKLKRYK